MADNSRIEELRRRVQMDPASIAFAALAEEYRRIGRCEEAVATCEAGLQRHPAYLSARVTLGRALLEMGRYDAAREELEHVLRLAPENLAAIRGLAEIHARRREAPDMGDADAPLESAVTESAVAESAAAESAVTESVVTESAGQAPPTAASAPVPVRPIEVPTRAADPHEAALPALEALLAAIVRAQEAHHGSSSNLPSAVEH